jgi:hypothetical protein
LGDRAPVAQARKRSKNLALMRSVHKKAGIAVHPQALRISELDLRALCGSMLANILHSTPKY